MGWTRQIRRAFGQRRRPVLEMLEGRTLLSTTTASGATDFTSITGAAQARSTYGVDGSGMTVAVIDTGINYNNTAFGGGGFGPGHKVVVGYDFADNSPDPTAVEQHGTAVAGLIASNAPSDPGIAPGADIADLRVFNNQDVSSFNAVASALQWVITNHAQYNITAVNISLTDGGNYQQNWFAQDGGVGQQVTQLIGQLDALNIPVITATGNSFSGQQGQAFPSIVPDTISVTGTTASDQLVSDAQRLGTSSGGQYATDIAAPGENLTAPVDGNNFATVDGTSFAAPQVTGAVVLLQQIYEQRFGQLPTVAQLDGWLKQGADSITDPTTGITIGRLDIPGAAKLIPGAPSTPSNPTPSGTTGSQPTGSTTPSTPVTNPTTPQSDSAPSQSDSTPPASNSTPPQSNSTPPASNSTPPQSNSTPPASNSTPPQSDSTPPASNSTPPQSSSTPPQSSSTPPASDTSSSQTSSSTPSNPTPTPTVTVTYNGQATDGSSSSSNGISSLVSVFSNMFGASGSATPVSAVSVWGVSSGTGSSTPVSSVSVWGVSTNPASTPQPAGEVLLNTQHPAFVPHFRRFRHH